MEVTLHNNLEEKEYQAEVDGHTARMEYILANNKIYLTHTEVPRALEGKGVASSMVKQVFAEIEDKKLQLVPLCPFVATYIKRHPEWSKLVSPNVKIR
jgi:predicted GNAT family acetyltransferase